MSDFAGKAAAALNELLAVMARLRDPHGGCPWDLAQSFASIAPYTLEEAYEVADAIERGDAAELRDELGDLLFQVVFHARMAEERGWFDFAQVAHGIAEKLERRHPHVFAGTPLALEVPSPGGAPAAGAAGEPRALDPSVNAALWKQWEAQKERERHAAARRRGQAQSQVLADVPLALPALVRAAKLGKRAARVGFDWDGPEGVREKVAEELAELDEAAQGLAVQGVSAGGSTGASDAATPAQAPPAAVLEELGDLLFALVNWGRHLRVDAETALRAANAKFEHRFAVMERLARERALELTALSPAQWESLWQESKRIPQAAALGEASGPADTAPAATGRA
ncbi:MAG TPA: nucleoside triphosphate pyrophosphohydrolase [Steroidobacteraceae bacterium]|nr:nucleoside triphosphate pyrophosphohydrolase [Steroidobacteraceae bacterium]